MLTVVRCLFGFVRCLLFAPCNWYFARCCTAVCFSMAVCNVFALATVCCVLCDGSCAFCVVVVCCLLFVVCCLLFSMC